MKKYFMPIFWFLLLGAGMYYSYGILLTVNKTVTSTDFSLILKCLAGVFVSGTAIAALLYDILYSHTVDSLNAYKRELEKESIDSSESSSKIKVLESKIDVLEKALENALNK